MPVVPLSISTTPKPEKDERTFTVGSAALKAGAATLTTASAADLTYGAAVSAARFTTGDTTSYACTGSSGTPSATLPHKRKYVCNAEAACVRCRARG